MVLSLSLITTLRRTSSTTTQRKQNPLHFIFFFYALSTPLYFHKTQHLSSTNQSRLRIEPATFKFVAQHLNHCATSVPLYCVLLNDIFTVLTHSLTQFSTFRGNIAPPKRGQLFTNLHCVTSHKNSFFIRTALRTSKHTSSLVVSE